MIKHLVQKSIALSLAFCSTGFTCPLCRDSVALPPSSGGSNPPVALFNASILCILAVFLLVAAFLLGKIIVAVRAIDRIGNAALTHRPN